MSNLPFLTLHNWQIDEIAASIDTGNGLAVRVHASTEHRNAAIRALESAGIGVPEAGAFTIQQLDAALDTAFSRTNPNYLTRRMELKFLVASGGMLLEKSPIDKHTIVRASLMLRKAGVPMPDGKAYTVAEFDKLLAGKDISPEHKIEIKAACSAARLLEAGAIEPKTLVQPIQAAKAICDTLGLEFPKNGLKLSTGIVDDAMAKRGFDERRRLNSKITLQAAGAL